MWPWNVSGVLEVAQECDGLKCFPETLLVDNQLGSPGFLEGRCQNHFISKNTVKTIMVQGDHPIQSL